MQPLSVTPVIELAFSPIVTIGDWNVRLETIGVAVAIFTAIVIAALIARKTPVDLSRPVDAPGDEPGEANHLRADDLLYIAIAAVPGAVVGARLGYALLHLEYYRANPAALLDIGQGGFQLSLGVVGGFLTAAVVAGLLGAPLGRWMHALVMPVLLLLAGGKAAMILGGSGQGEGSGVDWATAYVSPGPWGSLAPELPSHPSQGYEAIATVAVLLVVMWVLALGVFKARSGGAFLLGIGLWAVARALVATTWRDPAVVGSLRMDQVLSIAIATVSFLLLALVGVVGRARRGRMAVSATPDAMLAGDATTGAGAEPDWPDPAVRPRI